MQVRARGGVRYPSQDSAAGPEMWNGPDGGARDSRGWARVMQGASRLTVWGASSKSDPVLYAWRAASAWGRQMLAKRSLPLCHGFLHSAAQERLVLPPCVRAAVSFAIIASFLFLLPYGSSQNSGKGPSGQVTGPPEVRPAGEMGSGASLSAPRCCDPAHEDSRAGQPAAQTPAAQAAGLNFSWHEMRNITEPQAGLRPVGMAFDERDGYTLMLIQNGSNFSSWMFVNGQWSQLMGATPGAQGEVWPESVNRLTYDDSLQAVVFQEVNETWLFQGGNWSEASGSTVQPPGGDWAGFGYDPALSGDLLLCAWSLPPGNCTGNKSTWLYSNGQWAPLNTGISNWVNTSALPWGPSAYDPASRSMVFESEGGILLLTNRTWHEIPDSPAYPPVISVGPLSFDPVLERVVMFGQSEFVKYSGGYSLTSGRPSQTFVYQEGGWANLSIAGPAGDIGLMTFDNSSGAVVRYVWASAPGGPNPRNETWELRGPRLGLQLRANATPFFVCAGADRSCGAGVNTTVLSLQLATVALNDSTTGGSDSPITPWLDAPSITLVPWGSLALSPPSEWRIDCSTAWNDSTTGCARVGQILPLGKGEAVTWNWSSLGPNDELLPGDAWTLRIPLEVTGDPYGKVPADACVTPQCWTAGSGPVDGVFTSVWFSPYGNSTRWGASFPLALIEVLSPKTSQPPPSGSPPSAPPGMGGALPAPVPQPFATPSPQPVPTLVAVAGSAMSGVISGSVVSLGIVAAGITRAAVTRSYGQRVAMRVRVGRGRRSVASRVRGFD